VSNAAFSLYHYELGRGQKVCDLLAVQAAFFDRLSWSVHCAKITVPPVKQTSFHLAKAIPDDTFRKSCSSVERSQLGGPFVS
jgi:hypothetical protein